MHRDLLLRGSDALLEEQRLLDVGSPKETEQLRIGPYVLGEPLGNGGMSRVYKAEHRLMKRIVALKLVGRIQRGQDKNAAWSRFRREVEAAGRLRHPRIVTAYDAGVSRGWLYLAMEYLQGIDLQRFVENTGPLPFDLACEIVRQTAEALHHAHQRGLVHRDIKPSNLLLTTPGVAVKLLDLGLANAIDLTADKCDEEICGTPDFMAPEWAQTESGLDVRGDLYSLGCTFYYLLSGRVPYPGGSWPEKLLRHRLDEPTPLRQLRPEIPSSITAIVGRLMARDVAQRYLAADAVVDDLMALSAAPLGIREEQPSTPVEKQAIRRPWRLKRFLASAFLMMLLGVATAGGARRMIASPRGSATPPSAAVEPAFSLEGRTESFSTLAETIAAAKDGETILLSGSGPVVTSSLSWQGKALTLRAANGSQPRLELRTTDNPWQALLETDRALTLEGLELAFTADRASKSGRTNPLIRCTHAPLFLTNCRLHGGAASAALVVRNPSEIMIRNCRLDAGAVGISVEVGQGNSARLRIENTSLTVRDASGSALSLWAAEVRRDSPVMLEMHGNTIECGRLAALHDLPSTLTISARDNHLLYRTALLRYSGFAASEPWRATTWQGGGNTYQGPPTWLWVEDKPLALSSLPLHP